MLELQSNAISTLDEGIIDVRDFQTTGVVSAARGCPFQRLRAGGLDLSGKRVAVKEEYRMNCIDNVNIIIDKMNREL